MILLEKYDSKQDMLEQKALLYSERYGLFGEVVGEEFIWIESFVNEGTFKHVLNLNTMIESVEKIKKAYWE